jgi:N-acetylneuraminate synthase/sialic acid synthase
VKTFEIAGRKITQDGPAFVIAEIGHNHRGSVDICLNMIKEAKAAGADAIKLQRINAKELFTEAAYNEPYNSENAFGRTYGEHREALTLSDGDYKRVVLYCKDHNMPVLATAFEEDSARFLNSLNIDGFKLASFHLKDIPLINLIKTFGKPVIFSTGHADYNDIYVCDAMFPNDYPVAMLHCTSEYPVRNPEHINLGVINNLTHMSERLIGYSHHYHSPYPAAVAYHYGARIIEVHFTLNRAWKGTDQSFSLEPDGLKWLCNQLKLSRDISGSKKEIYVEEHKPIQKMSRSWAAAIDMSEGDEITVSSLTPKAPGTGLPLTVNVVGSNITRDIKRGEIIEVTDIGM